MYWVSFTFELGLFSSLPGREDERRKEKSEVRWHVIEMLPLMMMILFKVLLMCSNVFLMCF